MSPSLPDEPKTNRKTPDGFRATFSFLAVPILLALCCGLILGQAGRRQRPTTGGVLLAVVAKRADKRFFSL